MAKTDFPALTDDGLLVEPVHAWAEEKYRLAQHYSVLFCKSMRSKWENLVYIDLFSGPGRSKVDNRKIIDAPPMLVLQSDNKFDKYIFCDVDADKCAALDERTKNLKSKSSIEILNGDANQITQKILDLMPVPKRGSKVLGFCFVDPYRIENLKFSTVEALAKRYIDFLVLVPTGMDANRNVAHYTKNKNTKLDEFLGNNAWRTDWATAEAKGESFEIFVAKSFSKSMVNLDYKDPGLEYMKPIKTTENNMLLYRLALYSRNELGRKFWEQSVKYTNPQRDLF